MTESADQPHLRYRRLAQLCVDMLANTSDPETRVALLEMAQTWMRLAGETAVSVPQHVGQQQQQQIQPNKPETDDA
jgi:hypothetical protein